MESFFATLKKELVHRRRFKTREEAKIAIINYIETWYNSKRAHSCLDYMSSNEFHWHYNHRNSHSFVAPRIDLWNHTTHSLAFRRTIDMEWGAYDTLPTIGGWGSNPSPPLERTSYAQEAPCQWQAYELKMKY
jgi:hypothetical protein